MTSIDQYREAVWQVMWRHRGQGNATTWPFYGRADWATAAQKRPAEFSCADGASEAYYEGGLQLPFWAGSGVHGGSCSTNKLMENLDKVPGASISSWQAKRGDLILFGGPGWDSSLAPGAPGHAGIVNAWIAGTLYTCESDSGPDNLGDGKGIPGQGGTNAHHWGAPAGKGCDLVVRVYSLEAIAAWLNPKPKASTGKAKAAAGAAVIAAGAAGGGAAANHQPAPKPTPVTHTSPAPAHSQSSPQSAPKPNTENLGGAHPSARSKAASLQLRQAQRILGVKPTGHTYKASSDAFGRAYHDQAHHTAQVAALLKLFGLRKADLSLHHRWDDINRLAGKP